MGRSADRFSHRQGARDTRPFILNAADYAEGRDKAEAPIELTIRLMLLNYGTLYQAGGLADQPYSLMRRMSAALNVYEAMKAFRASRSWVDFQRQNPDDWKIVEDVMRLRQERDKSNGGY